MKILYLYQYFSTPKMAGGLRSYEAARRLVRMGHEVHMITSKSGDEFTADGEFSEDEAGIHVHWLEVPYSNRMSYGERIKAFFKFAWRAGIEASHLKGDVVFATSTPLTIALPAIYAAKRNKVPMVLEIRDLWPEVPIAVGALKNPITIAVARWLERFSYRNSAHIIALSPGMKEGIVATGYPEDRVTVIPNSCDLELFEVDMDLGREIRQRYDWLKDRPLVIYAGTLGLVNGVDYFAHLASEVSSHDQEIRFAVIGTGREDSKVRAVAEELGVLNKNFFMIPVAPKYEIAAWLSAADFATSFVIDLKELWNNSANKFFDTLAAGKPIAINHEGWQADIIRETGAGLVLSAKDINSAALNILHAVRDNAWLETAGMAAKKLAEQRFNREQAVIQLEHILTATVYESRTRKGEPFRVIKRIMNLLGAMLGLIILAVPLFVLAFLVRSTLGSPVLFRQVRPGLGGKPFTIYKFRTMKELKDQNGDLLPDEDRLTSFGNFMRSTSLDELPELFNVLRGDMNLVGPRPLMMSYLDRYTPWQARRHNVKPGITGWAQVNGRNGLLWDEKFKLDIWYVDNWSMLLDIKILFLTLIKVVKREGISAEGFATMPEFKGSKEGMRQ